ncbi:unnamed protein product [Clonostachys solani]|uniref:Uncharacterized protein n=1 Tax=Clonostachys solani TaxID=160281 RepID=A0A9N9W5V4_9HYPO|nr:unnamed protein product [Clonostachys solani]
MPRSDALDTLAGRAPEIHGPALISLLGRGRRPHLLLMDPFRPLAVLADYAGAVVSDAAVQATGSLGILFGALDGPQPFLPPSGLNDVEDVARAGSKRRGGGGGEQAGEKEDVADEHIDLHGEAGSISLEWWGVDPD